MRQFRAFFTYLSVLCAFLWVAPSRADEPPPKVLRIWTVGDSTAQPIGQGVERNVNDTKDKRARTFFRNSTGLARREFYDWPKVAKKILESEGYIADFEVRDPAEGEVGKTLKVTLKYGDSRERSIAGLRRISKPGLRVYAKSTSLPKVLGGMGIAIISTSSGLLTDRQAAKKGVGGEVLAYVW